MLKFMLLLCISQCFCLYRKSDRILKINAANFEDVVELESKPIVLHAYSSECDQCNDVAKPFMDIAEELKEITKFACIQIDKEKNLAQELGIKKPNSFYIVKSGHLQQFSGPITSKHIVALVMNQVLANLDAVENGDYKYFFKNVIQLTDDNFEETVFKEEKPWMILFYSPKLPESRHMIPIWYETAQNVKDLVKFGSLDCTRNLVTAKDYDVAGYPTGVLLIQDATYYLHYNVHLKPEFILEWIASKLKEFEEEGMVNELTSLYRYDQCMEKSLCVIVFVPHLLDCQAECRHNLLKIMMKVYDKYNDYKWGWLWSEAGSQGDLERSVDVDSYNVPSAVAINSKKGKFTKLRGTYSESDMDDFLQDILLMRVPSFDIKRNVRIHETDMWDGKDVEGRKNTLDYFDVNVKLKEEL